MSDHFGTLCIKGFRRQYFNHGRLKYTHALTDSIDTLLSNSIIECITSRERFDNPFLFFNH